MLEQNKIRSMFNEYSLCEPRLLVQTAEVHVKQNKLNYSPGRKVQLSYQSFSQLYIAIKKGDLRPKTHVPNLPPMMQKSLKMDDISDQEEAMETQRDDVPKRFNSGIKITVVSQR
jgi:hypothetical protein